MINCPCNFDQYNATGIGNSKGAYNAVQLHTNIVTIKTELYRKLCDS